MGYHMEVISHFSSSEDPDTRFIRYVKGPENKLYINTESGFPKNMELSEKPCRGNTRKQSFRFNNSRKTGLAEHTLRGATL